MARRAINGSVRVSGDTASHAAYGVGPASDYAVPEGTPICAPFAGVVGQWWSDTGGWTIRVDAGRTIWYGQHNSGYRGPVAGASAAEGTQLAVSGNTGSATTGPHSHQWVELDGQRISMEEYMLYAGRGFTPINGYTPATNSPAGGGGTVIGAEKDIDMTYALVNRTPGDQLPTVPKDAVFIGNGTEPLIWAANWGPEQINGVVPADWDHVSIAKRIGEVGLRGSGADINKVFKSMADAIANKPSYTLGGGVTNIGDVKATVDQTAVIAALEKNTAALAELLKATKALNPPG